MQRLSYMLQTLGLKTAAAIARALPEASAREFGRTLGILGHTLASGRREIAADNIRRALGEEVTEAEIGALVKQVFENIGRTAVEVFRFPLLSQKEILARVDFATPDIFDEALAEGKGAILLSAHYGNWELFGAWVAALGQPIDVVVKPQRNTSADAFYNTLRRANGVGIIPTRKASREIIRSLRRNRLVAILADQYAGNDGVPVEFFGRQTATHRGPAAIALKLGCPILHGVLIRQDDGRHQALAGGPLPIESTGSLDDDILAVTQAYTRVLEGYIRRQPGQWLWTHRRWKHSS